MAYVGTVVAIPMGQGGLHTDDSPSAIPPIDLIKASNVSVHANVIEKIAGSARLNGSAVPSGVQGFYDFWATSAIGNRRTIIAGGDGKIYAMNNSGVVTEITGGTAITGITNQVYLLPCGAESSGNNRKLFIFSGTVPVQVISGTAGTKTDISSPPSDWTGSTHPTFGIMHRSRVFAGGNANSPHSIYVSGTTNHEDFTTSTLQFQVFPGEGQKIIGATIFKGRLYVFKYPYGVYYLEDTDSNSANWYFKQASTSFGFASAHSVVPVLNDVLIKNASDSITSVVATLDFGDIQAGDVLSILKIEQYIRDNTTPAGAPSSHGVYYPEKKVAMFTYRSTQGTANDRILMFRVDVEGKPKATFITKDAPNCLGLRLDTNLIARPVYGSLDGYLYQMDQDNRNVNGISYAGEFQTPHLDFGFYEIKNVSNLASKNKNFDFLELRYVPQGDWNLYADIFIDGNLYETVTFPMNGDKLLADASPDTTDFILADSESDPEGSFLSGDNLLSVRKRIHGTGKSISVRLYNNGLNQTFQIATMIFSFRLSGEQQR